MYFININILCEKFHKVLAGKVLVFTLKSQIYPMPKNTAPVAYDSKIEGNVTFTKLDAAINWMRSNSLWPMPMGLACCGVELMATGASRVML